MFATENKRPTKECQRRLQKELVKLKKSPPKDVLVAPDPTNILDLHYVLFNIQDPHFKDGVYWGKIQFPSEFPLKPPTILMRTPNGRFKMDTAICMTMTNFHPESWNPLWTIETMLNGTLSYMLESETGVGTVVSTNAERRRFAQESLDFNWKHKQFRELFPDVHEAVAKAREQNAASSSSSSSSSSSASLSASLSQSGGRGNADGGNAMPGMHQPNNGMNANPNNAHANPRGDRNPDDAVVEDDASVVRVPFRLRAFLVEEVIMLAVLYAIYVWLFPSRKHDA